MGCDASIVKVCDTRTAYCRLRSRPLGNRYQAEIVSGLMSSPHTRVRSAAWLALGILVVLLIAAVVFQSGQTPITYAIRFWGPVVAIASLPLLCIALALGRGPSRWGFALGVAYPLAIFVALWRDISQQFDSGSEGAMNVMFTIGFFFINAPLTVFLLAFIPALVRLAYASWRGYRAQYGRQVVPIAVLAVMMFAAIGAVRAPLRANARKIPEYHVSLVRGALSKLNECIWRTAGPGAEAGFPAELTAIRSTERRSYPTRGGPRPPNDCAMQVDSLSANPFDVAYVVSGRDSTGRAKEFTLTLTEKTRADGRPTVVWIDQTGLPRQGVRATPKANVDSIRLMDTGALTAFLITQHLVDEYALQHGGDYPERIAYGRDFWNSAPPPDVLTTDARDCSSSLGKYEHPAASCTERWDRHVVYLPLRDASGRRNAYTLTVRPETYYDFEQQQLVPSRTHYRDPSGGVHSFGGYRSAVDTDPPPAHDELERARRALGEYVSSRK